MNEFQYKNKTIRYRLTGNGPLVMLVHGFGEDGRIWDQQIPALQTSFRLIIPDLPGSGQSEILDGPVTLDDYAEVLKALIDTVAGKEKREPISMIGHSMGGYITLAFIKKYPEVLNAFGLFHSSALADDNEKKSTRKKGIEFIQKNGPAKYLESTIPNLFSPDTKNHRRHLIQELKNIASTLSAEALIQYTNAMIQRADTTDVLQSWNKPVLFLIGVHDEAVPLQASLKQCYLPQKNTVHFLQQTGHVGMWEETGLSNLYLHNFLKNIVYPQTVI